MNNIKEPKSKMTGDD